jgi:asparagine N-glycosylation enzyme membrane subunit Stt3
MFSCSNDFLSLGQKEDVMPFVTSPTVRSFETEYDIKIEWQLDKGADEYILYRDVSADGSYSEIVYNGSGLSYYDTSIQSEKFYYYKLAKKQGYKEFDKSKYVPGILSLARKDGYENNNTKETSVKLDDMTFANIYYYKDTHGNEFEDKDWYYVDIKPWHEQTIQIKQYTYGNVLLDNDICFNLDIGNPDTVVVDQQIKITNNSQTESKRYYFQISVNKLQMLNRIKNYIIKKNMQNPISM